MAACMGSKQRVGNSNPAFLNPTHSELTRQGDGQVAGRKHAAVVSLRPLYDPRALRVHS